MKFAIGLLLSLAIATPTDPQRHRTNQSSNETNNTASNAISSSSTPLALDIPFGDVEAVPSTSSPRRQLSPAEVRDIEALQGTLKVLEARVDELVARPVANDIETFSMITPLTSTINELKVELRKIQRNGLVTVVAVVGLSIRLIILHLNIEKYLNNKSD